MSGVDSLLRRHRDLAGLTQEELAERAGLSARTVSDIERGLRTRLYADTAERLAEGLGLAGGDRAGFVAAARGRPTAVPRGTNLPRPITALVGRETELAAVTDALGSGRRLVTISGLGGIGKTRLALAGAEQLEASFDGRVHYLLMPSDLSVDRFDGLVAGVIGASDDPHALAGHLQGRPTLLLMDSFEHALHASGKLEALLLAAPDLHVLVTSREPLRITGEHHIALAPLQLPAPGDPGWHNAGATQLFLDRARDIGAQPDLDRDAVVEICRTLSGLPLALELAAAQLRYLPLPVLRDRLREGFTDLVSRQPGDAADTNPVQDAISWTIESLPADTAQVLQACALLPGGWRLDAIERVRPDGTALSAMTSLVDKGLAYLDHSTGGDAPQARWQMLDVVRGFVLTHPPDNAGQASRQTYLSFFIELLASTRAKLGREQEWFRVIEAEDANLRAALGWAAEAGDAQSLLRLANGMWLYWQARGALIEGRHWLDLGLRLDPPADAETRMVSLWATAMLAHHQGNDVEARERAEELRELATRHGDNAALRNAITVLGMTAMSGDDPSDAVSEFQRALELAATIDDEWIKATSHLNLGMGLLNAGEISDARLALGEALRRYEQLGDERFHARSVGYLGIASLLDGDPQRARSLFADSLQVFHRLGEPGGTAEALTGLAAADAAAGDAERAAVLAGAAERLRQSVAARQLPMDKRTNEHHLALAREQLGEQRWAGLWQAGHDGNLNDAVEQALMSEGA